MKRNNDLKKLVLTTIALLLLYNISSLALGVNLGVNDSLEKPTRLLYEEDEVFVNDDYNETHPGWGETHFKKIQDAIDKVEILTEDDWTINVCNGTYNEILIIRSKIILNGTNEDEYGNDTFRPRISDPSTGILIIGKNASGTDISGFDIINCNVAGIFIMFAESVKIHENKIMSNGKGIYLLESDNCHIYSNIVNNNFREGIWIESSDGCTVNGTYIKNNAQSGIEVYYSDQVTISGNTIAWNGNRTKNNWNIWLQGNDEGHTIIENDVYDSNNYSKLRFRESSFDNEWNDNYWNKYKIGRRYFIWGKNSFVFFSRLLVFQMDRSPQDDPYNYPCPVI